MLPTDLMVYCLAPSLPSCSSWFFLFLFLFLVSFVPTAFLPLPLLSFLSSFCPFCPVPLPFAFPAFGSAFVASLPFLSAWAPGLSALSALRFFWRRVCNCLRLAHRLALYIFFCFCFLFSVSPPSPHCIPGITSRNAVRSGGVPGRREPDTEPSGIVGGCGKPSACRSHLSFACVVLGFFLSGSFQNHFFVFLPSGMYPIV